MLVFKERGKLENPKRSLLEQGREPHPTYGFNAGFEPRPQWWKASALTTALTLLLGGEVGALVLSLSSSPLLPELP